MYVGCIIVTATLSLIIEVQEKQSTQGGVNEHRFSGILEWIIVLSDFFWFVLTDQDLRVPTKVGVIKGR